MANLQKWIEDQILAAIFIAGRYRGPQKAWPLLPCVSYGSEGSWQARQDRYSASSKRRDWWRHCFLIRHSGALKSEGSREQQLTPEVCADSWNARNAQRWLGGCRGDVAVDASPLWNSLGYALSSSSTTWQNPRFRLNMYICLKPRFIREPFIRTWIYSMIRDNLAHRIRLEPYNFVERREWCPLLWGPPWSAQCISYGRTVLNMVEVPVVGVWLAPLY